MRKVLTIVAVLLVAGLALAANPREKVVTADGGGSITTGLYFYAGTNRVDVASNGSATIKFLWFAKDATERADSTLAGAEKSESGVVWALRDWTGPRSFHFPTGAPDSFYVDVTTATEVIVSW